MLRSNISTDWFDFAAWHYNDHDALPPNLPPTISLLSSLSLSPALFLFTQVPILPMRPVGWMNMVKCKRPSSMGTTPARARRSTYCSPSPSLFPFLLTSYPFPLPVLVSHLIYSIHIHARTHTQTQNTMRHKRQPSENDCIQIPHTANPSCSSPLHIHPVNRHKLGDRLRKESL